MTSRAAARAEGIPRMTAKSLRGQAGILATLARDHREISTLLEQAIEDQHQDSKRETIDEIWVEILSHARAEESTLYGYLTHNDETAQLIDDSRDDHAAIKNILESLVNSVLNGESYQDTLIELQATVDLHLEEEESDIFLFANEILPPDVKIHLDDEFRREKQLLRDHLQKARPLSKAAH